MKWRESPEKYKVSTAFVVTIKTPCKYSTTSAKSFRTEIWGFQTKQTKISTISHPAGQSVIHRGSLFPPKDLLSAWKVPANSLNILFVNTWEEKSYVLLLWNLNIRGLPNPNQLFIPLIFSFCSSYSNVSVSTFTVLKPYLKIIVSLTTAFVKLHFFSPWKTTATAKTHNF